MPPPGNLSGFDAAVAWFRARVPIADDDFEELTDSLREQSFRIAGVAQLALVTDVWEAIAKAVEQGTSFDDFKDDVSAALANAWGGEKPFRVETIFRNWVQRSYAAGRYETMTSPAVKELRPYWEFVAIEDDRTTDFCDAADGTLLPADDGFWADHNPPCHHNCRSTVITRTADDALEKGVTQNPDDSSAPDGFGGRPDLEFSPDVADYPPALVSALNLRDADDDE